MKYLNETGDTIIEVLLAIAVVSAILGGAYISSNRSLSNSRQSEERGAALKLAEGQIERLKSIASPSSAVFSQTNVFCLDGSSAITNATNPLVSSLPSLESDNFSNYVSACQSGNIPYYLAIEHDSTTTNQFRVYVRWDRFNQGAHDQVRIVYRVQQ